MPTVTICQVCKGVQFPQDGWEPHCACPDPKPAGYTSIVSLARICHETPPREPLTTEQVDARIEELYREFGLVPAQRAMKAFDDFQASMEQLVTSTGTSSQDLKMMISGGILTLAEDIGVDKGQAE